MSDVGTHEDWVGVANQGADSCIPQFHFEAVYNKAKSDKEGRPVYDQVPFVRIIIPGDRTSEVNRKVQDADKERWPAAWERFERKQEQVTDGTPIEHWPRLNVSQVAQLKHLNIPTVEALASLGDSALDKIGPGARELQKEAQRFLKPQSDREGELREENRYLRADLEATKARLDEAIRRLDGMDEDKPKRGPGRPKKSD